MLCVGGFTLLCSLSNAQTPYYYYNKESKHYLTLDTEHAFLSIKEPQLSDSIKQRNMGATKLRSDYSDKNQYQGKNRTSRFYTELSFEEKLSEEQYLNLLSDIKRQNKDVIISPYFKTKEGYKIGLSNFFYVKLKEGEDTIALRQMAEQIGCIIIEQDPYMPQWLTLSITETSTLNAMECANLFYESGLFVVAIPDLMYEMVSTCVNDPYFGNQWGLRNISNPDISIKACEAWTYTRGAGVKLGIYDDGVEFGHVDLAANIDPLSFDLDKGTSPQDTIYGFHGTTCAGVSIGVQNNNEGVSGASPESRLVAITGSRTGTNRMRNIARGFSWAIENGVDVVNCSWKLVNMDSTGNPYIEDAIDSLVVYGRGGRGALVVCASGNDYMDYVEYPARLKNCIAVGSINDQGARSDISHYGTDLDLMGPGEGIYTTDLQGVAGYDTMPSPAGDYVVDNGTSLAAPAIASVCALVISVNPCLTCQEVREIVESTAQKVRPDLYSYDTVPGRNSGSWSKFTGYGLADAHAAVLEAYNRGKVSIMIRSNETDDGRIPNAYAGSMTESPDIWTRKIKDKNPNHQSPMKNQINYINVKIKNFKCVSTKGTEVLKIFWGKDSLLAWPSDWNGNHYPNSGPQMGNFIDSITIPVLRAYSDTTLTIEWNNAPNPLDYCDVSYDFSRFYLLAIIESESDLG